MEVAGEARRKIHVVRPNGKNSSIPKKLRESALKISLERFNPLK
jgi:hypothetical protein